VATRRIGIWTRNNARPETGRAFDCVRVYSTASPAKRGHRRPDELLPAASATAFTLPTEAVAAVDRAVATRHEGKARLSTARTADRDVSLALSTATVSGAPAAAAVTAPASVVATAAVTAPASVVAPTPVATRLVRTTAASAARSACLAARPATLRFVRELAFCVKRLLACGEHEWCPAIDARQCLVLETHACNLWPWPAYPRRLSASVRQPFRNGIASTSMQVAKAHITIPASDAPPRCQRSDACAD
jgi:hypothetical protein